MYNEFKQHLVTLGVSPNTVKAYLSDLRKAEKLGVITPGLKVVRMRLLLTIGWKPSTARRVRASIRKYANFLASNGMLKEIPAEIMSTDLPKIRSEIPRVTLVGETKALLTDDLSDEVRLMILVLASTGCRISSLAGLRIENFGDSTITFTISKGGKPYVAILTDETKKAFIAHINGRKDGWVFPKRGDKQPTPDSLRIKLKRTLGDKYRNPHSFRHGLATQLLDNGANLYDVKEILNHTSVTVTERYIHMSPKSVIKRLQSSHPFIGEQDA